jgi:hypothetical protein
MRLTIQCCYGPVEFGKPRPRKGAFDREMRAPGAKLLGELTLSGGMCGK